MESLQTDEQKRRRTTGDKKVRLNFQLCSGDKMCCKFFHVHDFKTIAESDEILSTNWINLFKEFSATICVNVYGTFCHRRQLCQSLLYILSLHLPWKKVSISAYIVTDDNMFTGDNICRQRHSTLKNHHCLTAIGVEHNIHFKTVFYLLTYHITIEISKYMKLFFRGLDAEFIYYIYKIE